MTPEPALAIHDLYTRTLLQIEAEGATTLRILADRDHLLRRFGLVEAVRLEAGRDTGLRLRVIADEAWALLEGAVEFVWHDERPGSPTRDRWEKTRSSEPIVVLAPFGVAFGVRALEGPALLLRLATHDDAHEGDRVLPWEEPA